MNRRFKIIVCRGPECGDRHGSSAVHEALDREVERRGLRETVELGWHSCFGRCTQGPNVLIGEIAAGPPATPRFAFATLPAARSGRSALYNGCSPGDAAELIDQHVVQGTPVRRLIRPIAPSARRAALIEAEAESMPATSAPARKPDGDG